VRTLIESAFEEIKAEEQVASSNLYKLSKDISLCLSDIAKIEDEMKAFKEKLLSIKFQIENEH